MAKRVSKRKIKKHDIGHFLPAASEVVKAIAMQGTTDDELALMFGLDPKIIQRWRKFYPSFDKALEEGRTVADANVVEALYKKATGTRTLKDVIVKVRRSTGKGRWEEEVEVHTIREEQPPETNAIKFWLSNRDPKRWNVSSGVAVHGKKDEPAMAFGVKNETKMELVSSILSLIQPKPDGV